MKKGIIIGLLVIGVLGYIGYRLYFSSKTMYYTYEDKFVMSSTAKKTSNMEEIKNDYYIKENINNVKSKEKVVEVLYSEEFNGPYYLYGYYLIDDFNNYFKEQIDNGFVCDKDDYSYALGEGSSMKCTVHESGFKYEKIDSELCVSINDKEVCIKPNDWANIEKYKSLFEDAGWICEYKDYNIGKWSKEIPTFGNLECSEEKPSVRDHGNYDLFCYINTDGHATCNNNIGWCSINSDLNTNCFGIK